MSKARIKKHLFYFEETENEITVPIGATNSVLQILNKTGPCAITDLRNTSELGIGFTTNFTLRPYQSNVLKKLEEYTIGVIESPTGTGKTYMMIELIKQKQQKTLILVDTYELANQFTARLKELTNIDKVGFVGAGKKDWQPVTVCLLQTMRNLDKEELKYVNSYFGMTLVDETHICAASTYMATLTRLNTKYKFGFSATPERADGLTKVIFWATGPKICKVTNAETKSHIIQPTIEVINTTFTWPLVQNTDYTFMIQDLSIDTERNKLIIDHYNAAEAIRSTQTVFLCTLRSQIYYLWDALGRTGGVLISPLDRDAKASMQATLGLTNEDLKLFCSFSSKKNRRKVIADLKSGLTNTVFSTYALFNKGIDIDTLETMYMCGPTRSKTRVLQSKGRIVRKRLDGKPKYPRIVVMYDGMLNILKWQSISITNLLKKSINEEKYDD